VAKILQQACRGRYFESHGETTVRESCKQAFVCGLDWESMGSYRKLLAAAGSGRTYSGCQQGAERKSVAIADWVRD